MKKAVTSKKAQYIKTFASKELSFEKFLYDITNGSITNEERRFKSIYNKLFIVKKRR